MATLVTHVMKEDPIAQAHREWIAGEHDKVIELGM